MPIDGSGNFTRSYNFVQDKTNGIKIVASRMDGEFDNYANALNQMLLRSGVVALSGNLNLGTNTILGAGNGLVNAPAFRFNTDPTSGVYMPASGKVALSAGGVNRVEANSTGAAITGAVTISSTLSVTGAATFGSNVTVTGRATAGGFTSTPSGGDGGEVLLQSVAGGNGVLFDVTTGDVVRFYNFNSTAIRFQTANGTYTPIYMAADGKVGINNTAPGYNLDVGGTLNASGAVTFGSTLNVTGVTTLSSMTLSTPLARNYGGTGLSAAPTNGQLLIGNGSGYALSTITAGSNVSVTNGAGTITISATGTVTSVAVSGGTTGLTTSGGPVTGSGTITLAGTLVVANGGTGGTTAAAARSNLGAAASGANGDITSLTGITTPLSIAQGGTGSTTASGARTNLGLGTVATQNANAVTMQSPTFDSAQWATVSGTAPLFGTRAWVLFNGSGVVSILGSGNVSSITDNGVGNYTINFTTAMPDANYAPNATVGDAGASAVFNRGACWYNQLAGSCGLTTFVGGTGSGVDFDRVSFRVER